MKHLTVPEFFDEVKDVIFAIDTDHIEDLKNILVKDTEFKKVILLGNGGSNAICAHIAEDLTKICKRPASAFTDAAMLTCYANDYGYENAYREYLRSYADPTTLVVLISSSGNSDNIVRAATHCVNTNIPFISFTGFAEDNRLLAIAKEYSEWYLHVDSDNYGVVECSHEMILHSVIAP